MQMVTGLLPLLLLALALVAALLTGLLIHRLLSPPRRTLAHALARGLPPDPGAAGYEFSEWSVERPDGSAMPVWDLPGGQGAAGSDIDAFRAARSETFVLLHAWGRSRLHALEGVDAWMRCASRIVIPELRGHGESTGGSPTYGPRETEDLLDLLERLEAPVVLVGTSLGAVIAIRAAAAEAAMNRARGREGRIVRVVALSPFERIDRITRARLAAQHYPAGVVVNLAFLVLRWFGVRPESTAAIAADVRVPLLVLHGADDLLIPAAHAEAIAQAAPEGRFISIASAGHLEFRDAAQSLAALPGSDEPQTPLATPEP